MYIYSVSISQSTTAISTAVRAVHSPNSSHMKSNHAKDIRKDNTMMIGMKSICGK